MVSQATKITDPTEKCCLISEERVFTYTLKVFLKKHP